METRWTDKQSPTPTDLERIFADLSEEDLQAYQRGQNIEVMKIFVGPIHLNDERQTLHPNVAAFLVLWDEPANQEAAYAVTVMQVAYDDIYRHRGHSIDTFFVPRFLNPEEAQLIGAFISTNALPTRAGTEWTAIDKTTP